MAYEDVSLPKNVREDMAAQAARVAIVRDVKGERITPGRYIPQNERAQLDSACFERNRDGTRSSSGVRDAAIMCTAWATGLRVSEIAYLDLDDIEREGQWTIVVRDGKGRKDRAVPVNTELKRRLREWLSVRGYTPGPLFIAIAKGNNLRHGHGLSDVALSKTLAKRAGQAGVKALTWHDFRRTFASDLLDKGVDIVTVQKLMGHSSPATTSGYDRRGERARRAAVEKLLSS
jgi:integrase